jgi:hypothetical protein
VPLADGLFFRLAFRHTGPGLQAAAGDGLKARAAAVAETFRLAFLDVWGQIPGQDRERLLTYWRGQPEPLPGASPFAPRRASPRIRIAAGVAWSPADNLSDKLGTEFTFPLRLVTEHPASLPHAIARGLAQAHRFASRRHWGLIQERIEEPLADWERRRGRKTDADRDAKLGRLEAGYLAAYEAEIAAILRGWGVDVCALDAEQPGRGTSGA